MPYLIVFWLAVFANDGLTHHSCGTSGHADTFFGRIECKVTK